MIESMSGKMEKRSANAIGTVDRAKLRASTTRLQFQRKICFDESDQTRQKNKEEVQQNTDSIEEKRSGTCAVELTR
jgi:hypothetical protein